MRRILVSVATGLAALGAVAAAAGPFAPERVSVDPSGPAGNQDSYEGAVTSSGRFVAFYSAAMTLVPGDTNNAYDVFVRDRKTGTTSRVSVATGGTQGDGPSRNPCISSNGRYVLFQSDASNLVPGDTAFTLDVFLHDRKTGETRRVSSPPGGGEPDGNSSIYGASLSANGRYAVFGSSATNLVAGDDNTFNDVFLADLKTGAITLVSRSRDGGPAGGTSLIPGISAGGRFVAFPCNGGDLVEGSSNGREHVYVWDRKTDGMRRVTVNQAGDLADGDSGEPAVSNDGNVVAFYSTAGNLVAGDAPSSYDSFVTDLRTGVTRCLSAPEGGTPVGDGYSVSISQNGRLVVFYCQNDGIVPEDSNNLGDVFAFDTRTGHVRLLTANAQGVAADGDSFMYGASLAPNGRWVAVSSDAIDLAPGPTDGLYQEYLLGTL